ncbi:flagellar basal body-associated FliL family protein [Aquabacterium sp.]|uniref:flagellar basal body-associated FliL family protein n=1 Tax=Aquabacterium sp. TaxID=1872578 RepID=UPI002487E43B|nr:flagellar basal body-associated FliL family protein [Aquabacterium sp.]MDI1260797.1 flagellar basal body-associated FliL family protein [Aquabacterium sp.]
MSAASAAAPAEGDAPKKGPKKLIIIIVAAVLLLVVIGGGAAVFIMKKNAAAAAAVAEGEDGDTAESSHAKAAPKPKHGKDEHATPPAFVPLDPFIVNLADKETERFAQIGLTLQVDDPKVAEEIKTYMPAIRNAVLMILSHKTSDQLLTQEGKEQLAEQIRREAARAMGYEIDEPEAPDAAADEATDEDAPPKKKKKKKKKVEQYNPIVKVNYANFIVQ